MEVVRCSDRGKQLLWKRELFCVREGGEFRGAVRELVPYLSCANLEVAWCGSVRREEASLTFSVELYVSEELEVQERAFKGVRVFLVSITLSLAFPVRGH